jgi:sec-independent protein translocase protein TatA
MGIFDWKHWVVILIVVVLVFGTKRLKNLGSDLGETIKGFRKAMNTDEDAPRPPETPSAQPPVPPRPEGQTIDAQAHKVEEPARKD